MNTKRLIYIQPDESIAIGIPSGQPWEAITGTGGLLQPDDQQWEITKQMRGHEDLPPSEFQARLAIATRWAKALAFGGLTEAQALDLIRDRDGPNTAIRVDVVDQAEIQRQDRYFRSAWECTGTMLTCNMDKAREVHLARIRQERDLELQKLDGPELAAVRAHNTTEIARIRALKNKLADIPQTFDLSIYDTPETLKAAWPVELPPNPSPLTKGGLQGG